VFPAACSHLLPADINTLRARGHQGQEAGTEKNWHFDGSALEREQRSDKTAACRRSVDGGLALF
jgi:hypothetical protein